MGTNHFSPKFVNNKISKKQKHDTFRIHRPTGNNCSSSNYPGFINYPDYSTG